MWRARRGLCSSRNPLTQLLTHLLTCSLAYLRDVARAQEGGGSLPQASDEHGVVSERVHPAVGRACVENKAGSTDQPERTLANWPRLAKAGGRPELDLGLAGLAGRAGGRIGRSLWAASCFPRGVAPAASIWAKGSAAASPSRKESVSSRHTYVYGSSAAWLKTAALKKRHLARVRLKIRNRVRNRLANPNPAEEAAHVPVAHPVAANAPRDLRAHVGERRRQREGFVIDGYEADSRSAAAAEARAMARAVVCTVVSAGVRVVVCVVVCAHPRGALGLAHVVAQLCDVRRGEEVVEDGHLSAWGCGLGAWGCRLGAAWGCRLCGIGLQAGWHRVAGWVRGRGRGSPGTVRAR